VFTIVIIAALGLVVRWIYKKWWKPNPNPPITPKRKQIYLIVSAMNNGVD
jgi:hypothetical protein